MENMDMTEPNKQQMESHMLLQKKCLSGYEVWTMIMKAAVSDS
jgi:hypothetical protein